MKSFIMPPSPRRSHYSSILPSWCTWLSSFAELRRPERSRCSQGLGVRASSQSASGSGGGSPGPLEVETAKVAGDIDNFADEKQPANFSAFHGLAGQLSGVDAARCDFGFFVAFGVSGNESPVVHLAFQFLQVLVGPGLRGVHVEPAFGKT